MRVLKFGGTSVGSAESIKKVVQIIQETSGDKFVVLSAFSGVTNLLIKLVDNFNQRNNVDESLHIIGDRCLEVIDNLFQTNTYKQAANNFLLFTLNEIKLNAKVLPKEAFELFVLAQGELISTHVVQFYLQEQQIESTLIPALDFMRVDKNGEPNFHLIDKLLQPILTENPSKLYLTQGFICRDDESQITNLQRGGSDYTASIIGAVIHAKQIQIWTDIDGMHNNDPRCVDSTFSVEEVSFDEAAELAYFGAKILHPQSLIPAREKGIPVLLKNTFDPEKKGTVIKKHTKAKGVTSIAAKDGITAIKIKSYRMLMAYGFLKRVFEVFETYKTPIDMITTSEVAVSLTIDNDKNLSNIIEELKPFGSVEVDEDLSIICVAGDFSQSKGGVSTKVFNALKHIPIRMISYGGSNYNISLLVKSSDKIDALNSLNKELFKDQLAALV